MRLLAFRTRRRTFNTLPPRKSALSGAGVGRLTMILRRCNILREQPGRDLSVLALSSGTDRLQLHTSRLMQATLWTKAYWQHHSLSARWRTDKCSSSRQ